MVSVTQRHGGLSKGIKCRRGLIELIRAVSRKGLGLNARQIHYLEVSIELCRAADFRKGAICAQWQGVDALAQQLGCSVRQVWNIETSLEDAGLIWRTFGRNGYRHGKRDGDKDILWAAGINLAPLLDPERLRELVELRKKLNDEEAVLQILRGQIQLVCRQIRAGGDEDAILRMEAILPGRRTSRLKDRTRLQELLAAMQAVSPVISEAVVDTRISVASEIPDAPYTLERPSKNLSTSLAPDKPVAVSPRQAMLLASTAFRMRVELNGGPSAESLIEVASQCCAELGISPRAWGTLCDRIGREAASLTILIIDRNSRLPQGDPYHVKDPAACVFGIAKRAKAGSVNLRGMLLAGHRMDLDRELPGGLSPSARNCTQRFSMGALLPSLLKNINMEVRACMRASEPGLSAALALLAIRADPSEPTQLQPQ